MTGPAHLGGLLQVVVRDLREQVVQHVRADVVVDLVEDAKVAVDGGQAAAQVAPLLRIRSTSISPCCSGTCKHAHNMRMLDAYTMVDKQLLAWPVIHRQPCFVD